MSNIKKGTGYFSVIKIYESINIFRFLHCKSENSLLTFCPLTPALSPLGRGEE
jgi:hypothetical protein